MEGPVLDAYLDGEQAAFRLMMIECARRIGYDDPLVKAAFAINERAAIESALRELAEQIGVPWVERVYLPDMIQRIIAATT